ncbi:tail fiber domain-containing protein, partial [Candidatus Nomurabacteria bacterium]|nr:tail fiber domain-containing protein [Candidatus Nomurabacteria bacterium]
TGAMINMTEGVYFYSASTNSSGAGATASPIEIFRMLANGTAGPTVLAAGTANSLCYNTSVSSGASILSTCSSDSRLKQNVTPLDGATALAGINALNTVSFNWDPTFANDTTLQFGLLAQEVAQVFPNLVSKTTPTPLTPDGTYSINFNGLYAPIIKSIQQMNIKVEGIPTLADQTLYTKVAEFLRGIAERGEAMVDLVTTKKVQTEELCIKKSNGTNICVTGDQLDVLLGAEEVLPPPVSPEPEPDLNPEPTPDPTCSDGILNQDETSIDEGGICTPAPEPEPVI